ncbi:MIP/aquaporin family protein [Pseudomonas aeruginosa]|uniref:MIP/aquaporin family protein n=1 Tax=Pseudomonas aeruginosa TaxID=287 RepID=UPI003CFF2D49
MLPTQWRNFLSELIGVFTLIFIGAGAAILSKQSDAVSYLGVALAFGVSVTCIISGISITSGAHLNPVVTLSLCATGRCSYRCLLYYTIAQIIGACLASAALFALFGQRIEAGTTRISTGVSLANGFMVEVILTFFLVLTVLRTTNALIIGAMVFLGALIGGHITGAGMNPARSFGPALFSHHWEYHWVYWLAPLSGALLAVLVFVLLDKPALPKCGDTDSTRR